MFIKTNTKTFSCHFKCHHKLPKETIDAATLLISTIFINLYMFYKLNYLYVIKIWKQKEILITRIENSTMCNQSIGSLTVLKHKITKHLKFYWVKLRLIFYHSLFLRYHQTRREKIWTINKTLSLQRTVKAQSWNKRVFGGGKVITWLLFTRMKFRFFGITNKEREISKPIVFFNWWA